MRSMKMATKTSKSAQQKIFDEFRDKLRAGNVRDKNGKLTVTAKQRRKLLEKIYDSSLPSNEVYFYTQTLGGLPRERVDTKIGKRFIPCTVAFQNELPAREWEGVKRPPSFLGPKWPPKSVSDLLGCSTLKDICIECEFGDSKIENGKQYRIWSAKMYDFWLDNIRLYRVSDQVGFGLQALDDIPEHTCIGEYTGEVVPGLKDLSDERTQYHYDIDIGPSVGKEGTQAICWLDATKRGSIFRFMNHSCSPNARVEHGRCGMHNRIMYVYTLKDIEEGEDITISYGTDWFSKPDDPCLCGLPGCRNPPKEGKKKKDDKGNSKTGNKITKDVERLKATKHETAKDKAGTRKPTGRPIKKEKEVVGKAPPESEPAKPKSIRLSSSPTPVRRSPKLSSSPPAKVIKKPPRRRPIIPDSSDEEAPPRKPAEQRTGASKNIAPKAK